MHDIYLLGVFYVLVAVVVFVALWFRMVYQSQKVVKRERNDKNGFWENE